MIRLKTTDNCTGKTISHMAVSGELSPDDMATAFWGLLPLSNKTLKDITDETPDLLVFPDCIENTEDRIKDMPVITVDIPLGKNGSAEAAKIKTGNIAGFIGIPSNRPGEKDVHLKITSRFVNESSGDEDKDYFLYYLLEKVFSVNLFDLKDLSRKGQFDFLLFLFPYYLKKALSRGLFKTYTFYKKNDMNIRGQIDMARHIKENTPFRGHIACNIRERTADNYLTQLIRHTIEVIRTRSFGTHILACDKVTKHAVEDIVLSTPSYKGGERDKIIRKNLKLIKHPYFTDYAALQKLCLAILRRQKVNYGADSKKIYGLLFDVAWLWEEYLAGLLKSQDFKHPENKKGSGWLYMFENSVNDTDKNYSHIFPDFYKPDEWFLDAKYKKIIDGKIAREDLFQVISYMHVMKIPQGGFIFPRKEKEKGVDENKTFVLKGYGGTIHTFGLKIPLNPASREDFADKMKASEAELLNKIER